MKKNKLLISITTVKVYEYNTEAETVDVAFDEYINQSDLKLKKVEQITGQPEIYSFKSNQKRGKNEQTATDKSDIA